MRLYSGVLALAAAALATAAPAQFLSDSEQFVSAVAERDGNKATEILQSRGPSVINSRNSKGETALITAISARDDVWTGFLLQKGANPNYTASDGKTPLIAAARIGFADAVEWLLAKGAEVDKTNRMGETPLIVAVQQREIPIVKMLLEHGADPDKADAAAGYSARDYARRDTRTRELLELIEAADNQSQQKDETVSLDEFKLK